MDRILISLKKENGPRASSAPALGLNTIIFKHVYWYMQQTQVSVYRTIGPLVKKFISRELIIINNYEYLPISCQFLLVKMQLKVRLLESYKDVLVNNI